MKLPLANPSEYGATLSANSEGFTITTRSGKQLHFPLAPESLDLGVDTWSRAPKPSWAVQQTVKTYLELDAAQAKVNQDPRFNPVGRLVELQPAKDNAIKTLSAVVNEFAKYEASVLQQETQRYVVPALQGGDLIGALRDNEIRTTIRAMSPEERNRLLTPLAEGADRYLSEAILRSPLKGLGNLEILADKGWRVLIDREDPEGRARIDAEKSSIDWAQRIVLPLKGMLVRELDYTRDDLYERVKGFGAAQFGFSPADIKSFESRAKRKVAA